MDYEQALKYIKECAKFGVKLGLERITEILKRLGNPQDKFRAIHIAGTNGKGSTAAMYDFVFQAAGYKTGRFTSPHLESYRERFTVNGVRISKAQLSALVLKIQPVLEAVSQDGFGAPTEFEIGVVIAFEFFAMEQVDIAVIEVGMGGRFDATNVIRPVLSVITRIDYDHQQYLGNSLPEIAFEKAGIIKPGVPVVIGAQLPGIESYLCRIAAARGSIIKLASDIKIGPVTVTEAGTESLYQPTGFGPLRVRLKLIGPHQAVNCLNVLAGVELLSKAGFTITKSALLDGLSKTVWPGRMERIPQIKPVKLYLDGAHNPDGARAVAETIRCLYPGQKIAMLVGVLKSKSYPELAGVFAEIAAMAIVTEIPGFQAVPAAELASIFTGLGVESVVEPVPEKALARLTATKSAVAVAAGSLYLIGGLRSILLPEAE